MKLLLDTHISIWSASQPEKLSRTVKRGIENSKNERHISPISIWEAKLLASRGKTENQAEFYCLARTSAILAAIAGSDAQLRRRSGSR
jgi:PIN domain nuclease of toxin-antitoxin system